MRKIPKFNRRMRLNNNNRRRQLLKRLQQKVSLRRQLFQNISHEQHSA